MSILSNSIYGSSTGRGVGGLMSGLDTDELVNQMTAMTRNKINRQYQAKQKLLYRQEAYREVSTKMLSFSNKYFSYSTGSKTNILSPSFFDAYTYKSSSSYVNISGNADSIKNFQIGEIKTVASAASFASDKKVSKLEFSSDVMPENISRLAGETFSVTYDGKTYNLSISKEFKNKEQNRSNVLEELNTQLSKLDVKDKDGNKVELKFAFEGDASEGRFVLKDGLNDDAYLSAGSSEFLDVLKMKTGKINEDDPVEYIPADEFKFTRSKEDILKSNNSEEYITFSYNGVTKNIKLADTEEEIELKDADSVKEYFQSELDKAFGTGKVKIDVKIDKDGEKLLTFSTTGTDETDILKINSISRDLSKLTGLESGDINRVKKDVAIEESGLGEELTTQTFTDEKGEEFNGYEILVNNKSVIIKEGSSLNDIIKKINSETDVTVTYSSTTDTFSVVSKNTGEHMDAVIEDKGGNLAETLFGTSLNSQLKEGEYLKVSNETENDITYEVYDKDNNKVATTVTYNKNTKKYSIDGEKVAADYHINKGTDTEMTYTLNGVKNTVKRSSSNFTIDDISIELNKNAATSEPITFDVTNNVDEVVEKVKNFINEYNEIITLIGTGTTQRPKRDYAPLTPEQMDEMKEEEIKDWTAEAKKGMLYSDPKMMRALSELRGAMGGTTDTSSLTLASIGISPAYMDTSGKLVLDENKFKQKLIEDPDEVANLFSGAVSGEGGTPGISQQLRDILVKNVGVSGTTGLLVEEAGMNNGLTADKNYISDKIKDYDKKMEELKKALQSEKERYWNQFAALEQSLSQLNAQSSWLTNMMGN